MPLEARVTRVHGRHCTAGLVANCAGQEQLITLLRVEKLSVFAAEALALLVFGLRVEDEEQGQESGLRVLVFACQGTLGEWPVKTGEEEV